MYLYEVKRRDPSTARPSASHPAPDRPVHWEPLPDSLARWTGHALAWVTGLAGQLYGAAMSTIGLQPQHVAILQILHSEGPVNQNRLARRTQIDKAPLVGLLNSLQDQGLIERRPHPTDRRAFEVHLTPAGRQKLNEAEQLNAEVTAQFFAPLDAGEQATLHRLLTRLASTHHPLTQGDPEDE